MYKCRLIAMIIMALLLIVPASIFAQTDDPVTNKRISDLNVEIQEAEAECKKVRDEIGPFESICSKVSVLVKEKNSLLVKGRDPNLCISCAVIIRYANLSNEYVSELSKAVMPGMQIMFFSLVGLWIVIQGYKILGGVTDPRQLYLEFMFVAIAHMLLFRVGAGLVNDVYHASLSVMAGASKIAFILAKDVEIKGVTETVGFAEYENLIKLIFTVENVFYRVFDLASNILVSGAKLSETFLGVVFALLLIIPYFLVALVFLSQVVISIFRLMMLAAFSPFLMMAYAFGWGRNMAYSAIRTLISSIAIMFAVTAAVAVAVYGVDTAKVEKINPINMDLSFSNTELMVVILLGWVSITFMTEATNIANSITGSALSNTGAGVMFGGLAGTAGIALAHRQRMNPLAWGRGYMDMKERGGAGISGLGQVKKDAGNLYQRVKDVSRGIER